ncbi:MAG: adenylate/guanylate cyclase domain-containing protein [Sandaracinaceae bacterium]
MTDGARMSAALLRDSLGEGDRRAPSSTPDLTPFGELRDRTAEREFQRQRFRRELKARLVWSALSAALLYLAFGAVDWLVVPDVVGFAWTLRFGFVVPVVTALAVAAISPYAEAWRGTIGVVHALVGPFLFLTVGAIAAPPGGILYSAFAFFYPTLVPQLTRLSVRSTTAVAVVTCAYLIGLDVLVADRPLSAAVFLGVFFVMGCGYGIWIVLTGEVFARESFWKEKVIAWQMEELAQERNRSEALLLNVLPETIADRLRREPSAIADAFEDVTVLFADIVGFTRYSAMVPADRLVARLDRIFSAFDDLAERFDLEKIKTIGDAYMVAGGLPVADPDHAGAVARMGLAMVEVVRGLDDGELPLQVRVGVHSGPVVAGVIGRKKFIYDLWGDTVNTASRMESHGEADRVQVSLATAERLVGRFAVERRGVVEVKGKGPMETYWLVGELDPARVARG